MEMQFGVMLRGLFDWGDDMPTRFEELMEQARLNSAMTASQRARIFQPIRIMK